jgi:hypothetical protein
MTEDWELDCGKAGKANNKTGQKGCASGIVFESRVYPVNNWKKRFDFRRRVKRIVGVESAEEILQQNFRL